MGTKMITVVPSIMSYDHCDLLQGVHIAENYNVKRLHVDIMDGVFVKNISFGPQLVHDLHQDTSLKLDVHLMLQHPEYFVEQFIEYGADSIAIHQESSGNIAKILSNIKAHHCACALAINPGTIPITNLISLVDYILVMGVHPGFSGQKFIPDTMNTIKKLVEYRQKNELNYQIAVDGGVTDELAIQLAEIGVDTIVSGNSFFRSPQKFMQSLQQFLK